MADGSLARRYARALVELGQEAGKVDRFAADLSTFSAVLEEGEGLLRSVLANPGLTTVERRGVLDKVLEKLSLDPMTGNLLKIVVDNSRFDHIDEIARAYQEMADEAAGRVRATVVTARPLGGDMAERVKASLSSSTGMDVILTQEVDPKVLGGMVVHMGDTVYDASVRARLSSLEQALLRTPGEA